MAAAELDETISTIPTKPHTSPSAPAQGIRSPKNRRANTSTNSGEVLASTDALPAPARMTPSANPSK